MDEEILKRRRRDYRMLAVMAFNLVVVWFVLGKMSLDSRHRTATVEIAGLVLLPLTVLYLRSKWPPRLWVANLFVLPLLWFSTYSLLHEGSHVVGVLLIGDTVVKYHLIPHFWQGEFTSAWIQSAGLQGLRGVLPGLFPYLRDFVFLIAGWMILRLKRITSSFFVGLVLVIFCLSPLFDIEDNYCSGYLLRHAIGNDFTGTAMMIGETWTNLIGIFLLGFASCVIGWVLWLYTDFPYKPAEHTSPEIAPQGTSGS